MNKKKIAVFLSIVLIVGFFFYQLLFGKFFPYSPIAVGFDKHEFEHVIVYVQRGNPFNRFNEFDSYTPLVEDFHKLKFKKKPKIFLFGNRGTYARRSHTKARFCAHYNGNIVVSPWAQEESLTGLISMEIYLRHELSHSLLHQQAGIVHAMKYPKWLLEGIAMYSANQMGTSWYPGKDETYGYIRQGNFIHPKYYKTKNEEQVKLDVENRIAFIYSEFACIVDHLIQTYGMEKFFEYVKQLLDESNHDAVFKEVFQVDFESFILNFKEAVSRGPAPTG